MRQFTSALCALTCLALIGNSVATVRVFADGPAEKDSKSAVSDLPTCLEKLNLTDDQKTKAKEIAEKYQSKIDSAWKHFSEKYIETVRTEVALMAAIEDHLNDAQRESLRTERRKHAHSDHSKSSTKQDSDKSTSESRDKPSDQSKQQSTKSPVERRNNSEVVVDEVDEYVFANGITLTIEQETNADRISTKYARHLRRLQREIRSIHNRLIALEADKLVELEKLLTKEQAAKLREERQSPLTDHKVTSTVGKNAETND